MTSRHTAINNTVWVDLALIAADLLTLSQSMLLTDEVELHRAEPKTRRPTRCATGCCTYGPDHQGPTQGVLAPG